MERPTRKQSRIPGIEEAPGLEELNLVEFPLAVLADSPPKGQKTLEFEDTIFDKATGQNINRRCIITGSDKWGLLNWFDSDVIAGLMQLTNQQHGFRERKVTFTLYALARTLKLPTNDGRYSDRLATSLLRIIGSTIAYIDAWRECGKWKSVEAFHLLDNLTLSNTKAFFDSDAEQHLKWNDRVVESVQRQNTKGLDWEFYTTLKRPTAKRLYRFLDKRFGLRSRWSYELTGFCPNKLGMSSEQATWVYRKSLKPGIRELVDRGFLADLDDGKVFTKEGKVAIVNFQKRAKRSVTKEKSVLKEKPRGLEKELLSRGVSNAVDLVATHSAEKIREQIENFDDRNKNGEEKKPGWLRMAIEDDKGFGFRKGFTSTAQRVAEQEARQRKQQEMARVKARKEKAFAEQQRKENEAREQFLKVQSTIPIAKRWELEDEALKSVPPMSREFVLKGRKKGEEDTMFHQMLWEEHIIPNLN